MASKTPFTNDRFSEWVAFMALKSVKVRCLCTHMGDWFQLCFILDNAFRIGHSALSECASLCSAHSSCRVPIQAFIISVIVISKLFYSLEMVYLLSGTKFGFPQRKVLPENLLRKCENQDWSGLQIRSGLVEGNGVFAQEHFVKKIHLCVIMREYNLLVIMQKSTYYHLKINVTMFSNYMK